VNRFFQADKAGALYELHHLNAMGLLGGAETIDELIDRHIKDLPAGTKRFEFEITGRKDEVTVAVGFRSATNWTVVLAADLAKDDQVVRLKIGKSF
jgi:hypothetical protein